MKVGVLYANYIGLPLAVRLAEAGNKVVCYDRYEIIEEIKRGVYPDHNYRYKLLPDLIKRGMIKFTDSLEKAVGFGNPTFICTTFCGDDLSREGLEIGKVLPKGHILVNRCQNILGSTKVLNSSIEEGIVIASNDFTPEESFTMLVNPYFVDEGRVVIGSDSKASTELLKALYADLLVDQENIFITDPLSAELIKERYFSFEVVKSAFMLQNCELAKKYGGRPEEVERCFSHYYPLDTNSFYTKLGYPEGVSAIAIKRAVKMSISIQENILRTSAYYHQSVFSDFIHDFIKAVRPCKKLTIWGLSTSCGTPSMENSLAIQAIALIRASVNLFNVEEVVIWDKNYTTSDIHIEKFPQSSSFCEDMYDSLEESEGLLVLTEMSNVDYSKMKEKMSQPVIYDGVNTLSIGRLKQEGFTYNSLLREL